MENIGNNPSTTPKRYGYVYDKLNRLTAGFYQTPNNAGVGENTESLEYDLNGNITRLFRTAVLEYGSTTPTKIDDLEYLYAAQNKSNKLITLNDTSFNPTGYEGGGMEIKYDANGNMTEMPDKGINKIDYNYLNLPNKVNYSKSGNESVIVNTKYSAGGEKLQKENNTTTLGINGYTTTKKITDYLDGFQYLVTVTSPPPGGGSESMMANSETGRALERQAYSPEEPVAYFGPLTLKNKDLQFFPTAEGFYDYKKDQYIYQYKDHLGNARVSFGRNSSGNLEITDSNDYYPFGMNHLKSGNAFFGAGSYKNYKYNGKELQETGMYDYGARMYMSDIGRWGVVDPLAETSRRWSTYTYAYNNPIRFIDPDGMQAKDIGFSQTVRKDGTKVITMTVTGKVINDSGKAITSEQMNAYADRLSSSIKDYYGSASSDKFEVNVVTNITVASNENKLTDTDHVIRIVNAEDIPEANGDAAGKAPFGQNVVYINSDIVDNKPATDGKFSKTGKTQEGDATLERTGAHEIGHSGGLTHTESKGNLMVQSYKENAGTKVTKEQILKMKEDFDNGWTNQGKQK